MGITISKKEISLDLQNQGFTNTIYSQEGDADLRQLVISLFDDGEELCVKGIAKYKIVIEEGNKKLSSVRFKVKLLEHGNGLMQLKN